MEEKQTDKKPQAQENSEPQSDGGNGKAPGNVIDVTEEQFKEAAGADPGSDIEVISAEEMNKRLGDLLSGEEEPGNEFVAYLVAELRAGNAEYRQVQQAIQELNQRLGQLQKRAIQLQGEQSKYAKDIQRWMDRDTSKPTGKTPEKESDDG